MHECSCGGTALPDPEHRQVIRCLSCWHSWTLPREVHCPGALPRLMPALRMLDERRDLNR